MNVEEALFLIHKAGLVADIREHDKPRIIGGLRIVKAEELDIYEIPFGIDFRDNQWYVLIHGITSYIITTEVATLAQAVEFVLKQYENIRE